MPIAHEEELRDLAQREREADDAVAAIVGRKRQAGHHARRDRQPVRRRVHLVLGQIELARPDVLVRVELDLLEADDARDDVDLAVRFFARYARLKPSRSFGHDFARLSAFAPKALRRVRRSSLVRFASGGGKAWRSFCQSSRSFR